MPNRFCICALFATTFAVSTSSMAAPGDVFFVNVASAPAVEDGLSWATAFNTIEEGVEKARASFGGEVWVARGVYSEARSSGNGSLVLRPGVDLYGGFVGDETSRSRRNPRFNATVIDGATSANGSPASPVVEGADDAVLDGFHIRGGRAAAGAGMINVAKSPVVRNCVFTDNVASQFGGAVLNFDGARPLFVDCIFEGNSATVSGGAVSNTESAATFTGCVFEDNSTGSAGGAMFNTPGSSVTISGCRFEENSATVGGGAIFNEGASPFITDSVFIGNSTEGFGGALFNNQAADVGISADVLIINTVLARNTAGQGGGAIATQQSSLTVLNATIADNTAPEELGGAFFNNGADTEVTNAIIWYNSAEWIVNLGGSFTEIRWSNVGGGDPGPNNIALEPRFMNRTLSDYRLAPDSPSIDAGTADGAPETDLLGVARPLFDGVDQGAYESRERAPEELPMECHGNEQAPTSAMPDPASGLLLFTLLMGGIAHRRRSMQRK